MSTVPSENESSYVSWKGWVDDAPFGQLGPGDAQYFGYELRKVRRAGAAIKDVLEIGYGNGTFLAYCRDQGWNATGTELDLELVAAGTKAGFRVFSSDETEKLEPGSFDLIAIFDVLEHIPQEGIIDFLSSLASKLRPGGQILLRFPNADSWLGNPLQNGDPTHVTAIGYLKMTYFALHSSLQIVTFTGAHRRGYQTSLLHGIYGVTAGPLVRVGAAIQRLLFFPMLPVILWASNVVCVLRVPERE